MPEENIESLNAIEDLEISSKRKNSEKVASKHKKIVKLNDGSSSAQIFFEDACSNDTVDNVMEDMEEEIDNALEQTHYKNKLTPAKVKNILRHIIANEYVLAMVRNTMKPENSDDEEQGDSAYEPKLTRSKAKEMRKKQYTLPWPVSSPVKKAEKVSQKLLEEEFPDESSSDEDYKPNEEESHSDDDDVAATSPKASDSIQLLETIPSSSPVQMTAESLSDEENIPARESVLIDIPPDASEADKIALRTRSKLCLNDTPLEDIEASFIAPDITIDMYDTKCDDEEWQEFLRELCKPIGDELNALMAEILDFAQQDLGDLDDEEEEENRTQVGNDAPPVVNVGPASIENVQSQWMSSDERLQLDEQMRMYVQILTQSYLLSHGNPQLNFLNVSSKLFLDEIKMFASREMASNKRSAFYAQNLNGALEIVNEYENRKLPLRPRSLPQMKKSVLPKILPVWYNICMLYILVYYSF
ncbi:unnamed protein product [Larinioides sclopetarius]|uniref:GON-4-like protein n=1 Tax=Larinioides sclopetarius TaxID=280406 RepID=A0AAV1ZSS1_9ARAC